MPKFSIVMPVYGVELYLRNSIDSVLNQTFTDFELILVDDESPDQCPLICDEYANSYPQVKVIHQKNTGVSGARNKGYEVAIGDYILCPDSDDILQPDTLEYFNKVISDNPSLNFIFSDYQGTAPGNEFVPAKYDNGYEILSRHTIQKEFLNRKIIILAAGTLLNLQWCKDNNLYYEPNPYGEDQQYTWKVLLYVDNVAYIKKPLYNYVHRPGSTMTASGISKIVKAYPYFQKLNQRFIESENAIPLLKKYFLSIWVRGILHSAAKLVDYKEYKELMRIYESDVHLKKLLCYPSLQVRILALIYFFNKRLFYIINKKK